MESSTIIFRISPLVWGRLCVTIYLFPIYFSLHTFEETRARSFVFLSMYVYDSYVKICLSFEKMFFGRYLFVHCSRILKNCTQLKKVLKILWPLFFPFFFVQCRVSFSLVEKNKIMIMTVLFYHKTRWCRFPSTLLSCYTNNLQSTIYRNSLCLLLYSTVEYEIG